MPLPPPTPAPTYSHIPAASLSNPWAVDNKVNGPRVFDYFPLGSLVDLLVCENITLRARAKRSGVPGDNEQWFDLVSFSYHDNELAKVQVKYSMTVNSRKWFDLGENQGWFDIMKSDSSMADPATTTKSPARTARIVPVSENDTEVPVMRNALGDAVTFDQFKRKASGLNIPEELWQRIWNSAPALPRMTTTTPARELDTIAINTFGSDINRSPDWKVRTADGAEVSVSQNGSQSVGYHNSEMVDIRFGGGRIQILSTAVTSSDAHYAADKERQPHPDLHKTHTHLDIRFASLSAATQKTCTRGILAEMWGLAPMSGSTTAMLSMGMQ